MFLQFFLLYSLSNPHSSMYEDFFRFSTTNVLPRLHRHQFLKETLAFRTHIPTSIFFIWDFAKFNRLSCLLGNDKFREHEL